MSCTKISLYIPPKRAIEDVIAQLKHERHIASKIKDDDTRERLITVHDTIIYLMEKQVYKNTDNGLIIFADWQSRRVIRPQGDTVGANAYYCDDHYHEPQRRVEGLVP